ncbi:MAG: BamA/TamA family outer membrane protein [Spirosomataceae bacterium]
MARSLFLFLYLFGWLLLNVQAQTVPVTDTTKIFKQQSKLLVVPLVGRSPETNWNGGFAGAYIFKTHKTDSTLRTSTIPFGVIYTTRKQLLIGLGGNVFFPKEKYILRFENTFSYFPDRFWGLGNNTKESNLESYTYLQYYLNPQLLRHLGRNFFVGAVLEHQNIIKMDYTPNGLFDQENVTGREGGVTMGIGGVFTFDSRNHAYVSNKGSLVQLAFTRFHRAFGSDFTYSQFRFDLRKYLKIGREKVLALQSLGIITEGNVQFRSMGVIGGSSIMRGYYNGRYRDKVSMALQAEFRTPIYGRLGMVAFAGIGRVAPSLATFELNDFKKSFGAGLRFAVLKKEKFNVRVDYGFGEIEGKYHGNLYVVAMEAF